MRSLALFSLPLIALSACARGVDTPEAPPERPYAFEVPEATSLRELALEAREQDGWTIRRVPRPESDARLVDGDLGDPASKSGEAWGATEGTPADAPGRRSPEDPAPPSASMPVPTPRPPGGSPAVASGPAPSGERDAGSPAADPRADEFHEDADAEDRRELGVGGGAGARGRIARVGGVRPTPGVPLRAGSTDDNAEFEAFLEFLGTWTDKPGVADQADWLDVSDRRMVRVVDEQGRPVPGVRVSIVDDVKDKVVWSGTTYGDGRVPFYPQVLGRGATEALPATFVPENGWLVEVRTGDRGVLTRWDGQGYDLEIPFEHAPVDRDAIQLDVCFVIDTTGSMGDEIERIKSTLGAVTDRLQALDVEFDLRYGAVLYRDISDDYVTKSHPFTGDIDAFAAALQQIRAMGGGDGPESLNQGLAEAVGRLSWREGAAKVCFLIADAPPHMDYDGDVPYGTSLLAAVGKGIRIHSVAASGLDNYGGLGSVVFRQIAQFTRGRFIFIEYGSKAESAGSHGVSPGAAKSNNLDDILYERIQEELSRWGQPDPEPEPEPDATPVPVGATPSDTQSGFVGGSR